MKPSSVLCRARLSFFKSVDEKALKSVIRQVMAVDPHAIIAIKSTIPVGFKEHIREKIGSCNILFSSEFLRESKALYDNLYPSQIIVGTDLKDERLLEAGPGGLSEERN